MQLYSQASMRSGGQLQQLLARTPIPSSPPPGFELTIGYLSLTVVDTAAHLFLLLQGPRSELCSEAPFAKTGFSFACASTSIVEGILRRRGGREGGGEQLAGMVICAQLGWAYSCHIRRLNHTPPHPNLPPSLETGEQGGFI